MISLIFDTETTGLPLPQSAPLEKQPKIIDFALIKIENGKELSRHEWLINPSEAITPEITKITGLKDEDVKDAKTFPHYLPEIEQVFKGVDAIFAHNLPFDKGMMMFELRRCGKEKEFLWPMEQICTAAEFKHIKNRRMRLIELYEVTLGKPLDQKHRAMADCEALLEILMARNMV
jgi:DNA polymerase III subunit epsilon